MQRSNNRTTNFSVFNTNLYFHLQYIVSFLYHYLFAHDALHTQSELIQFNSLELLS